MMQARSDGRARTRRRSPWARQRASAVLAFGCLLAVGAASADAERAPFAPQSAASAEHPAPASLLTGIVLSPTPLVLRAVIAVPGGGERSYRIGDTLADGSTLTAIHADRVVLRRNASDRVLRFDLADANPPAAPLVRVTMPTLPETQSAADNATSRTAAAAMRANPALLVQLLPLDAILDRQRMVALRVGKPEDESLIKELKLVPGDVIIAINDVELNGSDPDGWTQAATARADALTLKVYRDGHVETLRY